MVPEYTGMTPQRREKRLVLRPNKRKKHQNVLSRLTYTGMTKERTLIQRCRLRVKEYEEYGDHWQARPENSNSLDFVRICMEVKNTEKKLVNLESKENIM